MTAPLLQRLRTETADLHQALEDHLPLLDPAVTRETYRDYLARLLGFYEPLEKNLDRCPPLPDWPERHKSHLLERDLLDLGLSAAEVEALPRCTTVPEIPDRPTALGCGYVLEGATLGGVLLRRHMAAVWGLEEDAPGLAFYSVYGDQNGARWQIYRTALTRETDLAGGGTDDMIVSAATETFRTLLAWLVPKQSHQGIHQ